MKQRRTHHRTLATLTLAALAAGCGGTTNIDLGRFDGGAQGHSVGGTVQGLVGSGLILRNSGGDDLRIGANQPFTFSTRLLPGASYVITVFQQPKSPVQTCTISGAQGAVALVDVIDIQVRCLTGEPTAVSGAVSGLAGVGLLLQNNGGDDLPLPAGATSFNFATQLARGAPYEVTIKRQPTSPLQICAIANAVGAVGDAGKPISITCADAPSFAVSGKVTGLTGAGLSLADLLEDIVHLDPGATSFTFSRKVQQGARYSVTVKTQPAGQFCAVQAGSGVMGAGPVSLSVDCGTPPTVPVGGTVQGLRGSGLVLLDNGGDPLPVLAEGSFQFLGALFVGAPYAITVGHQPTAPNQTCTVSADTGSVGPSGVSSVSVLCTTDPFFDIGGTVSGLAGSGLILQNELGDDLPVTANGDFAFDTGVQSGLPYSVTVKSQPTGPLQTCTVDAGSGVVAQDHITTIAVSCTANPYFAVGGTVSGLAGQGLVLHDNGGDDLTISQNGAFAFPTTLQGTQSFSVSVAAQPFGPYQICTVSDGEGTVGAADVATILVTCQGSPFLSIGGTVLGLRGSGLVLRDDGGDDLPIAANGSFTFPTQLQENVPFRITVLTQPAAPLQTCTISQGSGVVGTADVSSIGVTCADNPSFTIGGRVVGLAAPGLVLRDNGGDDLHLSAAGTFTFATALQEGQAFAASIAAQPAGQICAVTAGGAGMVGAANITSIGVSCGSAPFFSVKAQVSGLSGAGLVLRHDGSDDLPVVADGTYAFADQLTAGQTYAVTVKAQPAGPRQTCTAGAGASGAIGGSDVVVPITCSTNPFFNVTGVVTGLGGAGLVLLDNGADPLPLVQNGSFTFATQLQGGQPYAVSVATQPGSPLQICSVSGGRGTVGSADVTGVIVSCQTSPFFLIGGVAHGVAGAGLVVQEDGGGDVPLAADGLFIFTGLLQAGQSYSVTIKSQPANPFQTCTLTNGSGIVARNVTNIQLTCVTTPSFTVGGTVTGLTGAGLVLLDNGADALAVSQDGAFTFATPVQTSRPYSVSVQTQPSGPVQSCALTNRAGTMGGSAIGSVAVVCTTSAFTVGGSVTGLPAGSSVTLLNDGFDARTVAGSGTGAAPVAFLFGVPVASGRSYAAVQTATSGPVSCSVTAGANGAVTNGNLTAIQVTCVPAFTLSGTLSGVAGTGLVLTNSTTGEALAIAKAATTFAFARPVTQAQGYSISATSQPAAPTQSCTPSPQAGNPAANVTTLAFTCATTGFTVGGSVTGLPSGSSVTLLDNGADSLTVNGAGTGAAAVPFTFAAPVPSGATFAATVVSASGPVSCRVSAGGSGTIAAANVSTVQIACVPTFAISGAISSVTGGGLVLKNGPTGETLSIAAGQTAFAFTQRVTQAQGYAVSVVAQPSSPAQVCGVSGASPKPASGNPAADVTTLALLCATSSFVVGGQVNGLPATATVTLQNGADTKVVTGSGTGAAPIAFTFPALVGSGEGYSVSVSSQAGPVSCRVASGGNGTVAGAAVGNVQIACAPAFSLSGTVAGYAATGLQITSTTTGETLTVAGGATTLAFTRLVTQAQGFSLSVTAQPTAPTQSCNVLPASGSPSANVSNLAVTCATTGFSVGGTVAGLPAGASVTLLDNGADPLTVGGASDGSAPIAFAFATAVKSGQGYAAAVSSSAGPVLCSVASGGSGTIAAAPVANVAIACSPAFSLAGTIAGYAGAGLSLKNNATGETVAIAQGATSFAFSKLFTQKQGYALAVTAQPTVPSQACAVLPSSPAFPAGNPAANVANLVVTCATTAFSIGGAVTGLPAGASVTLLNNGADSRTVNGSGTGATPVGFNFVTALPGGQTYAAALVSSTGPVSCALSAGSGSVVAANINTIQVACAPGFTIAGTIAGYSGASLQLVNATSGEIVPIAQGQTAFSFKRPVSQAQGYAIAARQQPVNPSQSCAQSPGSPSPAAGNPSANVTDLALTCTTSRFTVGGVINGLAIGTSVQLQQSGGDDLHVSVAMPRYPFFNFATPLPSGQSYRVTVKSQPPGQVCALRAGTDIGLVGSGNVTSAIIDCAPSHTLSGTVSGLVGAGLVLTNGGDVVAVPAAAGAEVPFSFPTQIGEGAAYRVNVSAEPGAPAQACVASGGNSGNFDGSGTMGQADDGSIAISCGTPAWRVGGQVIGLATGASVAMALLDNSGDQLVLSGSASSTGAAIPFQFATPVRQGLAYSVTVQTPPSGLACIVRNGSGTVGTADVTSPRVICGYAVAGTFDTSVAAGAAGQLPSSGLALQDTLAFAAGPFNDTEALAVPSGAATFAFAEPIPRGGSCALAVTAQPKGPAQVCTVSAASGCTGGAVAGPIAAKIRCLQQLELVAFPGATGSALAVGADSSGDLFAGGNFTGSADLGHGVRAGSTFSSAGSGFALGLDPNGARGALASPASASWDRLFPATSAVPNAGSARVRAVAVAPSGDALIGGSFTGSVDFGDGAGAVSVGAVESMFLARLTNAGAIVWVRHFGAGAIGSLATSGTAVLAGGVYSAAAGGAENFGAAACALTAASAHRDFAARFDLAAGGCGFAIDLAAGADPASATARLGPAVALDSLGSTVAAGNAADSSGLTALAAPYLATFDAAGKNGCFAGGLANEIFRDAAAQAHDQVTSVAVGASDAIFVSGFCQASPKLHNVAVACGASASSAFVVKYLARASCAGSQLVGPQSGAPLAVIASAGSSKALALDTDAAGNVYAAGAYSGTPSLAGVALLAGSATEAQNAWLARFPAALTAPTVEAINATGPMLVTGVTAGAAGSAWVSGAYAGSVSYKGATALGSTAAAQEPMLVRFPQGPP